MKTIQTKQVRQYWIDLVESRDHASSAPKYDVLVDGGSDSLNMSKHDFKNLQDAKKYFETFRDKRGTS